jgi:hypothetical protein
MDTQTENIIAIWQAAWYELDQPIKLGLKEIFWLTEENDVLKFHTGFAGDKGIKEIKGEILKIKHRIIGEVSEIDAEGLSYTIKLISGQEIIVEAEESPGKIENDYILDDKDNWKFEVTIKPIN